MGMSVSIVMRLLGGVVVSACFLVASCSDQVVVREVEAKCGNGTIEAGEVCDDGNAVETDACTGSCKLNRCGDGILRTDLGETDEGYEACDDGNLVDEDGCTAACLEARCAVLRHGDTTVALKAQREPVEAGATRRRHVEAGGRLDGRALLRAQERLVQHEVGGPA